MSPECILGARRVYHRCPVRSCYSGISGLNMWTIYQVHHLSFLSCSHFLSDCIQTFFFPPHFSPSLLSFLSFSCTHVAFLDSQRKNTSSVAAHPSFRWIETLKKLKRQMCVNAIQRLCALKTCSLALPPWHTSQKKRAAVVLQGTRDNKCFHTCTNTHWDVHPKNTQSHTHIFYGAVTVLLAVNTP